MSRTKSTRQVLDMFLDIFLDIERRLGEERDCDNLESDELERHAHIDRTRHTCPKWMLEKYEIG